ncbi:hypothetical protein H2278_03875 [Campylobacter sp. W0018]|nr:hypothetical protein [Campylobacter sp. W0018]
MMKADRVKFKEGYFRLNQYIKEAKDSYYFFKEFNFSNKVLKAIDDNKQLFLQKFPKIKNLLNIHKDYQPIIDNIFHNFDYVIKNFNLIEEWLLSNDFNEKYKKENHPYPSLLDPKKLNDENEEINYKTIPAQLVWEMNLSLPDNYEFIIITCHHTGSVALCNFLVFCCECIIPANYSPDENGQIKYLYAYKQLLKDKNKVVLMFKDNHKFF